MKSIRLTNRDKQFIKFMSETNLVFTNQQIGNIFYKGGNEKSSYMIANRRLRKLYKDGYIKKIEGNIGEKDIYYHVQQVLAFTFHYQVKKQRQM